MLQKVCIDEKNQNRILHYNLQWFAKDGEGGEKTEPATAKKLKDARDEGKVAKSRELNSAFDLIVLFLCLKIFVSFVGGKFIDIFSYIYENMPDFVKINKFRFHWFCGNFPSYLHNADQKRNNKSKRHKRKHNEQAF